MWYPSLRFGFTVIEISGLSLRETVWQDPHVTLTRGVTDDGGRRVLVCAPRPGRASLRLTARLKHDHEVTTRLADIRLQPVELLRTAGGYALLYPDDGLLPLASLLRQAPIGVAQALHIGRSIADILTRVHAAGIIHKDVQPANVWVTPDLRSVRLGGFGFSSSLRRLESPESELEGTLAYIAPEQTGRTNRWVDHRTDFYALGVTLYELLAGHLPFNEIDPMALVYAHIAQPARPLVEFVRGLPVVISGLVQRLMAKSASDRYQSSFGVRADLDRCVSQLQAPPPVAPFVLGQSDVSDVFAISETVYGREAEIAAMLAALGRANSGRAELVLIGGMSGTGKSSLVREFQREAAPYRALVAEGKFDQYGRDVPYSAILQAFRGLVRKLLTQSGATVADWSRRIRFAVGENGQEIIQVIPEIELIIGPQPALLPLVGPEAQARFNHVFRNFVRALTGPDRPIVLFTDDLHWADLPSFRLLQVLLTDPDLGHFVVVGPYRNGEVNELHPLTAMLGALEGEGMAVTRLMLEPLGSTEIIRLVADSLHVAEKEASPLAALIEQRTDGNPYAAHEYLAALHRRELIWFDAGSGRWAWDTQAIELVGMHGDISNLVRDRVECLPLGSVEIVSLAAAIGAEFDLATVALACGRPIRQVAMEIEPVMRADLVIPMSEDYKYTVLVEAGNSEVGQAIRYRFRHDRVQEAAYDSIRTHERPGLHARIGRAMLAALGDGPPANAVLFELVGHLNLGLPIISAPAERWRVLELNLLAAQKAKASNAYSPALAWLKVAIRLTREEHWTERYETAFAVHLLATEVAYLATEFDEMAELTELTLARARTALDKASVLEIRIQSLQHRKEHVEAVRVARSALILLGERLPENPTQMRVILHLVTARWHLSQAGNLTELREMTDPTQLAVMRILVSATSSAFFVDQAVFPLIVLRLVTLTSRFGVSSWSAYGYVTYGLLLTSLGDVDGGFRFGELALATVDRFGAENLRCKVMFVFNLWIRHWKRSHALCMADHLEAMQVGRSTGDIEYVPYNSSGYCMNVLAAGLPLSQLADEVERYVAAAVEGRHDQTRQTLESLQLPVLQLRGLGDEATRARLQARDEATLAASEAAREYSLPCFGRIHQMLWLYLSGRYDEVVRLGFLVDDHYPLVQAMVHVPHYKFVQTLALIRAPQTGTGARRCAATLRKNVKQLRRWAESCPENYLHKLKIVEGVLAHKASRQAAALLSYEQAFELARKGGFLADEVIAAELAAGVCADGGLMMGAGQWLSQARDALARWGGFGVLPHLDARWPHVRQVALTTSTEPQAASNSALDLDTVLRAARAISSVIVLKDLLAETMRLVMASAGAQRGCLLLERDRVMCIAAMTESADGVAEIGEPEPLGSSPRLCMSALNYALRKRELYVSSDAGQDSLLTDDVWVAATGVRSLLVAPLLLQGNVTGALYLENNLSPGVFGPQRAELVRALASQAALAVRNAQLFERERALTRAQERFVPREFLVALGHADIASVGKGDHVVREMTVLFSDIRGFTAKLESLPPDEALSFVNHYLSGMEPAITRHGGFIDNYIGDAIMALFPGGPDAAVLAAVDMFEALDSINERRRLDGKEVLQHGIGVNTGQLVLGTIGGQHRLHCTVLGDAVNLAARLEQLTKSTGARILVTEETQRRLGPESAQTRRIDDVRLRGRQGQTRLYEILDALPPDELARRRANSRAWIRALGHMDDLQWEAAADVFGELAAADPTDHAAVRLAVRCRQELAVNAQ